MPFRLPDAHRKLFYEWSHSADENPLRARNARILLRLDAGHELEDGIEDKPPCRQSDSEVRRTYRIFGTDGVKSNLPNLGRKPQITYGMFRAILRTALYEEPPDGDHWTSRELAEKYGVSNQSLRRMLRRYEIYLEDKAALRKALATSEIQPIGLAGLLGNYSTRALAFWCKQEEDKSGTRVTTNPASGNEGNTKGYLARQQEQLNSNLLRIEAKRLNGSRSNTHDNQDALKFASILEQTRDRHCGIALVVYSKDDDLIHELERYADIFPAFRLSHESSEKDWLENVQEKIVLTDSRNQRKIAYQLENINIAFDDWWQSRRRKLGTFVWRVQQSDIL
jgi:hypothetical protein